MFSHDALAGKRILITGGGSGLGLSMAQRFAGLGASVAINGRSAERLQEALATIDAPPERIFATPADVRDPDAMQQLVDAVVARFGAIDVLVNNAAGNFLAATEDLTPNGFNAIVQTVLYGTFHATLAAGRHMIERGAGHILNIATTYAWTGSAFVVPSACAKAGVLAMTRSLAVEWAHYGLRCNAIAPGPFPTEGAWSRLMPDTRVQEMVRSRIPLKRFGEHAELANLAAFLVSDAATYINGECITIDGGEWMASGGEFNGLTALPREELKEGLRKLRPR